MKKIILLLPLCCFFADAMLRARNIDSRNSFVSPVTSEKNVSNTTAVVASETNPASQAVVEMKSTTEEVVNNRGVVASSVSDFIDKAAVIIDQCCGCLKKHKQLFLGKDKLSISNVTKEQIKGFCKDPEGLFKSVPDKPLVYSKVNEILMSTLSKQEKLQQLKALLKSGKSRGIKKRPDLGIENIFAFYSCYVTSDH